MWRGSARGNKGCMETAVYIMNALVGGIGAAFYVLGILGRTSEPKSGGSHQPPYRLQLEVTVSVAIAILVFLPYVFLSRQLMYWDTYPLRIIALELLFSVYFGAVYGLALFQLGKRIRIGDAKEKKDLNGRAPGNTFE